MQSFLKLGAKLSLRYSQNKIILCRCIHSNEFKNDRPVSNIIYDKYESIIDDLNITKNTEEDKIRKTEFGFVRLDVDNTYNNSDYNEDVPNEEKEIDAQLYKENRNSSINENNLNPNLPDDQNINIESYQNNKFVKKYISNSYQLDDDSIKLNTSQNIIDSNMKCTSKISLKYNFNDSIKNNDACSDEYLEFYSSNDNTLNFSTFSKTSKENGLGENILNDFDDKQISNILNDFDDIQISNIKKPKEYTFNDNEAKSFNNVMTLVSNSKIINEDDNDQNDQNNKLLPEISKKIDILGEKIEVLRKRKDISDINRQIYEERKERRMKKASDLFVYTKENNNECEKILETVSDAVDAIRKPKDKLSSKYKKLLNYLPNYYSHTRYEITKLLKQSVIYQNKNIVAICKPYGIEMHDGAKRKKEIPNLVDFLPDLADILKCEKLYPIHRLDATTTGALLLAKNLSYARKLKDKFKKGEIQKTYIAITKGVPVPSEGVINIFIGPRKVDNRIKMDVKPDIPGFRPQYGVDKKALTKYEVLSSTKYTSVVEVKPLTGVKHQIRVHLGIAMKCPILGDHKYSKSDSFSPQRLESNTLQRMDIKQSRVRDLPIFLHASRILIPDIEELNPVHIHAKIPKMFISCIKMLGLGKSSNRISEHALEFIEQQTD